MAEKQLAKGQTVRVYQQPYTSEEYEGDAVLIRPVEKPAHRGRWEVWMVRFAGEAAPYRRLVHPQDIVTPAPAAKPAKVAMAQSKAEALEVRA
jgi:hypothetical protein